MNYYVISPNVYKDGIDSYLEEMRDRHIAIIGWGKSDNKFGNMFAQMKIDDRVIIAHGANRNKRTYYAGIVASESKTYNNGESQYVELYNFKDIRSYKIPFSENNTYGASNQIVSIYRLKPEIDSDIIDCIEQIFSVHSFNIRDVEFWARYPNKYISIPSLQRGLVWKPKQVELLWDSILRNFPLGSFMLSEIAVDEKQKKQIEGARYYLIDGQQRFNSIALGYNAYDKGDVTSIVWFDLNPESNQNSTRKYWIKLTTKSHPWGYNNNDECSTLSAEERRSALKKFGLRNIYNDNFDLKKTYPVKAKCPIPLFWLLKAPTINADVFAKYVKNEFDNNNEFNVPFDSIDCENIKRYYDCFHRLKKYTINTNLLTAEVLDNETESEKTGISDIEVLFNRIGAGGTAISENELLYSAIKAYWPEEVKEKNDELAAKYMPPVTLIMLAFRLSLTTKEENGFNGTPSIKRIRQIAREKGELYNNIIDFYNNEADHLLMTVNDWLIMDDAPTVIRTNIARKCPDIFLLLLYIAKMNIIDNIDKKRYVQALTFYIYWFGRDNCNKCVNTIFSNIKNSTPENFKSKVIESLLVLMQKQLLGVLYEPSYISSAFDNIGKDSDWRPWSNSNPSKPWWPIWNIICNNKELLLYAQRKYLKENFSRYDPAKLELWDEHNRPWDYDHIIPQDWVHRKGSWRKVYTDYCEAWLNCNGNFAAIPFEKNRGKSNYAEWDEYINNKESLLCDDEIGEFNLLFNKGIQTDKEQAHRFAVKTKDRTIRIYEECYKLLSKLFEIGTIEVLDSEEILSKRKTVIKSLQSILGEQAKVFYSYNGEEFEVKHALEWAMPELTVGVVRGNKMACMYFQIDNDTDYSYWVGIGKAPHEAIHKNEELQSFKDYQKCNNDEWWYLCKKVEKETNIEIVAEEIRELIQLIN